MPKDRERKVHPSDSEEDPKKTFGKKKIHDSMEKLGKQVLQTAESTSPGANQPPPKRDKSTYSIGSSNDSNALKLGKMLVETPYTKLFHMKYLIVAFAINVMLLVLALDLAKPTGLLIPLPQTGTHTASLVLALLVLAEHIFALTGMNDALSAYAGHLFTHKKGYSIALSGFIQSGFAAKIVFASKLSYKSTAKKLLSNLGLLWLFHMLLIVFGLLAATQAYTSESRYFGSTQTCIIYHQNGELADRGWPPIEVEMGAAEFLFGDSLGIMRAQEDVPVTTFVMPPQLVGNSEDLMSIYGGGFIHTISTKCVCAASERQSDLIAAGVRPSTASKMFELLDGLNRNPGLVNDVRLEGQNVIIDSLYPGTSVCGGSDILDPPVPLCKTTISDMFNGIIDIKYISDSSPASTTASYTKIISYGAKANATWLNYGFNAIFGGAVTSFPLPSTFPGAVNPIMWWTTPSMQATSAGNLEEGMEVAFAILSKIAIRRTFATRGAKCRTSVVSKYDSRLHFQKIGVIYIGIFIFGELLMILICFAGYIPWIRAANPMGPAIRFAHDRSFFTLMMAKPSVAKYMAEVTPNCEKEYVWPKMDVVLKIGENIDTVQDPDEGLITIDKAKMVGPLSFDKLYH